MAVTVRKNERSWAIDLITRINAFAAANDLVIKRAGGESTISTGRGSRMFPDVILYGNQEQNVILQGWELKMPDVPIEDELFIKDAQRKAVALNLNSCLIWNFTYAVLYVRDEKGDFVKLQTWDATSYIHTRKDVETYRADWEALLETILLEINGYFVSGQFHRAALGEAVAEGTITALIRRNKNRLAGTLQEAAFRDNAMAAYLNVWWTEVKAEYERDETSPYKAYAKTVLLGWANRILFAHSIKSRQNGALLVDELDYDITPGEANRIFEKITTKCDFYNVFAPMPYNHILPEDTWEDFVEFSLFLKENGIGQLDQEALQNVLEGSVAMGKRAINGQFTTPPELARLLLRLTVKDWSGNILDCCCGTGTIPREAIRIKRRQLTAAQAMETVWACDKNRYPLQVASLSMTNADTVRLASRLFQHNALTLTVGEEVSIVDPATGDTLSLALPAFDAVVSNLPFVPFELIPEEDKARINQMPDAAQLDGRSDLYCYIAAKIADVMKPGGMLGIIVSNSWLGTRAGARLMEVLGQKYHLRQVHISGKGRWFQNAAIVTTLLVLEKKADDSHSSTDFWLWNKQLGEFAANSAAEDALVNSALLGQELDPAAARQSHYTAAQLQAFRQLNISYNALFHRVEWLLDVQGNMLPIQNVFQVFRGSRRGWDALFYPKSGTHHIEPVYLKKVLLNARNVTGLTAVADQDAFCCGLPEPALQALGHTGALEWIGRFRSQVNGVGKPLPAVLKKKEMQWYELQENEIAEIVTTMNPDQRIFFARFETPSFVNQRLIGLVHRAAFPDEALNHALLNSMFTMFSVEAAGFGRGLGVLDINKDSIAHCYMLNPQRVSAEDRQKILAAFEPLKNRPVLGTAAELRAADRIAFEHAVLRSFGMDGYFEQIKASLLSMQQARAAVRLT